MLSSGTRIGPNLIKSWLVEGSCGQSYECERNDQFAKKKKYFVKLVFRNTSEIKGFSDFFTQECQALQQLEGKGIWPVRDFGVMKWKHWVSYDWFEERKILLNEGECREVIDKSGENFLIRSLEDLLKINTFQMKHQELLAVMTDLHIGMHKAHSNGFIHGNLKPSNILIRQLNSQKWNAWIAEIGLYRLSRYKNQSGEAKEDQRIPFVNLEAQDSLQEAVKFRPPFGNMEDSPEESWDIFALGQVVRQTVDSLMISSEEQDQWLGWAEQASRAGGFASIAHSMKALPGVKNLSEFGISLPHCENESVADLEKIRSRREREWHKAEKLSSLKFRRNMTGFVGIMGFTAYVFSSVYLYFLPAPWTEYSLEGALDSYQLGAGLWSGQAWGILPGAYDDDGDGGQNVVGEWNKEGEFFKLSFRKFKKINKKNSDKKLWQFIGKGSTSPDDYHKWTDYLTYDRNREVLQMMKRVDESNTYLPAKTSQQKPRLYPKERISRSEGKLILAELSFEREDESSVSWELFIGLGFLLASSLYQRELLKVESVKDIKD